MKSKSTSQTKWVFYKGDMSKMRISGRNLPNGTERGVCMNFFTMCIAGSVKCTVQQMVAVMEQPAT